MAGEKISIMSGEVTVEGRITYRSGGDICVEITKPYQGLSTGLHIPYFGRPFHSFDGEYGDECAKELLTELYEIALHVESNMDSLRIALREAQEGKAYLTDASMNLDAFLERKRELKQRLNAGEIDNRQFQKAVGELRREQKAIELQAHVNLDAFFEKHLPMVLPVDLQRQVLTMIEGKGPTRVAGSSDF